MFRRNRILEVEAPGESSTVVRITNLLFAVTVVSIFAYLMIYYSSSQAGNGGEYWGFSGFEDPRFVVTDAIRASDYRLLAINLDDQHATRPGATPGVIDCENHPFGSWPQVRRSESDPLHGTDSLRLARSFSYDFNTRMGEYLNREFDAECRMWYRR